MKISASSFIRAVSVSLMLLATSAHATVVATEVEVVATGLHFPEGAIFVGETLYFVDYVTSRVLRLVGGEVEAVWNQNSCGANGLVALGDEILVACYDNGTIVRMTREGNVLETISHDSAGGVFIRPNDLATDAVGGVYFTASGNDLVSGKVYYRASTGKITMVACGVSYANGIAVANDGLVLYLAESQKHRLLTFQIDANGHLSHQAELVKLANILADNLHRTFTPDAVRVDKHGRLFIGLYDGGGFAVLTGGGKLIQKLELPGAHHASLAISPDGKSVFVTATDDTLDGSGRGRIHKIKNPTSE